ncbi:HNH endonuclease [Paenibacillus sp. KR2-11]|uniref:HNH endonuclease n=1 Tax=Paenibacillus sp. KR2-11 TaxID=3385500 RepID=UPI0038FCE308
MKKQKTNSRLNLNYDAHLDDLYFNHGITHDPIMVNSYVSEGWDPTSYDYEDEENIDLFRNFSVYEEDEPELGDFDLVEDELDFEDDEEYADDEDELEHATPPAEKVIVLETYRQKRDYKLTVSKVFTRCRNLSDLLKFLYNDACQVCGHKIDLGDGDSYSETHHIQPRSEAGPDVPGNMIVVCRNCHILFDRGAITIDLNTKQVIHQDPEHTLNKMRLTLMHTIEQKYINYHNYAYGFKV